LQRVDPNVGERWVNAILHQEVEDFGCGLEPGYSRLALPGEDFGNDIGKGGRFDIRRFSCQPVLQFVKTRPEHTPFPVGDFYFTVAVAKFGADTAPLHPRSGGA
jgi:hypothetical protein